MGAAVTAASPFVRLHDAITGERPPRSDAELVPLITAALHRLLACDIASEAAWDKNDEDGADDACLILDETVDELLLLLAEAKPSNLIDRLASALTEKEPQNA